MRLRTLHPSLPILGLVVFLLSFGSPSRAASRQVPSSGPVAGPVEVFTDASVVVSPLGTLIDTTTIVENQGSEPVTVFLVGELSWPDGTRSRLRFGQPMSIPPNGAMLLFATSLVPGTVGAGPGSYTATAFVAGIGMGGRASYRGPLIAQDQSPFVLP